MPNQEIISNAARGRLLKDLPVRERRLKLAGILTAVLEGGEGGPVVLLHGPGAHAAHWMRVIPRLARTYRVIAPDLPCHGASETFGGEPDVPRVLSWLDALIEQTCERPPALVGHLMGGAIAARYAAERPAQVRHLMLIDTFGLTEFAPAPEFGAAIAQFFAAPSRSSHKELWLHCVRDLEKVQGQLAERWQDFEEYNVQTAGLSGLREGLSTLLRLFAERALPAALLQSIAAPTTLVWGRHDRATPLSVAEEASKRYGWPLHVIEEANDDPPIEQPEALLSLLHKLLSKES
jgi:pimeloyl-ACP methyl ester carboxylesterase